MNNSRRARRIRLWPGLDELEDKCLLSPGTLGHLPRHAVEVHTLQVAQTKHAAKPSAHAPMAKHTTKPNVHAPKAKHTPKPKAHAPKAHPKLPTLSPPVARDSPSPEAHTHTGTHPYADVPLLHPPRPRPLLLRPRLRRPPRSP